MEEITTTTNDLVGTAVEISTQGRPNFFMLFCGKVSTREIQRLLDYDLITRIANYKIICKNDEVYEFLKKTSAR